MPKYYVDSGLLQYVCEAEEPVDAALQAIVACDEVCLGVVIRVNEQGYDDIDHESDVFFPTIALLDGAVDESLDEDEDLMDI